MANSKHLRLEQELINAKAITGGLFAVVTDLMIAHAKVVGSSPDDGLLHASAVADESLANLEAEVRPASSSMQGRRSAPGSEWS